MCSLDCVLAYLRLRLRRERRDQPWRRRLKPRLGRLPCGRRRRRRRAREFAAAAAGGSAGAVGAQ